MRTVFVAACAMAFCLCGATVAFADTGTITVMHTNDMHGYYNYKEGSCIGLSPLKALVDTQNPDLLLDAGDTFHGQSFATVEKGESIARLMDALGYDATTPGNHDWSYGASQLQAIDSTYNFSVLAANVQSVNGGNYFSQPYVTKDVTLDDGRVLKVGVLGVIDQAFYTSTAATNVEGVQFQDPVSWANNVAADLKNTQGCDLVIALTHNKDPQTFASQTSNIDAVIAGHEHVLMNETVTNSAGVQVPVVEAGYYLGNAGVLTLTVDYEPGQGTAENVRLVSSDEQYLTPADAAGKSDTTVAALISSIEADEAAILGETIGTSKQSYPYSWEDIRTSDQALGHAITASYLATTGADVALENAGGIRGGIPAGTVTAGDMLSISPYGNTLATYSMGGDALRNMLEHSLEISYQCNQVYEQQKQAVAAGQDPSQYKWPDNSGSVLVFGGMTLEVDWSKAEGERIKWIMIKGANFSNSATYTVAMNSYIPSLTAEYGQLSNMTLQKEWGTCEQALRSFVSTSDWEDRVYPLSGTATYFWSYDLWVGGVQVTSKNMQDVLGDGTVSFDPTNTEGLASYGTQAPLGTLTLNYATIRPDERSLVKAGILANKPLAIELVPGSINTVSSANNAEETVGIQGTYQLLIKGGGQLRSTAETNPGTWGSTGIHCASVYDPSTGQTLGGDIEIIDYASVITIGGSVSALSDGYSLGIAAPGSLIVQNNAQLIATGGDTDPFSGLSAGIVTMPLQNLKTQRSITTQQDVTEQQDIATFAMRSAEATEASAASATSVASTAGAVSVGQVIIRDQAHVEGKGDTGGLSSGMAALDVVVQDSAYLNLAGGPSSNHDQGSFGLYLGPEGEQTGKLNILGGEVILSADSKTSGVPSKPLNGAYTIPAGYELKESDAGLVWSLAPKADPGSAPAANPGTDPNAGKATTLAKTGDPLDPALGILLATCTLAGATVAGGVARRKACRTQR